MQMNLALSRLCRVQVSASAGEGVCTGRPLLRAGVERRVPAWNGERWREGREETAASFPPYSVHEGKQNNGEQNWKGRKGCARGVSRGSTCILAEFTVKQFVTVVALRCVGTFLGYVRSGY